MMNEPNRQARFLRSLVYWPAYAAIFFILFQAFARVSSGDAALISLPVVGLIAVLFAIIGFLECLYRVLKGGSDSEYRLARLGALINGGLLLLYVGLFYTGLAGALVGLHGL